MSDAIAVIPARKLSQRFPTKNLALLAGRPLLAYAVAAASESGLFDSVVVSSDSPDVLDLAVTCGASPHHRPDRLAEESVRTAEVVEEVLAAERIPDSCLVVQLQVTSPLRRAFHIRGAVDLLRRTHRATSVVSVCEYAFPPQLAFAMKASLLVEANPGLYASGLTQRAQLEPFVHPNGAVYAARAGDFRAAGSFYTPFTAGYLMAAEYSVDVDTPFGLALAEVLTLQLRAAEAPAVSG